MCDVCLRVCVGCSSAGEERGVCRAYARARWESAADAMLLLVGWRLEAGQWRADPHPQLPITLLHGTAPHGTMQCTLRHRSASASPIGPSSLIDAPGAAAAPLHLTHSHLGTVAPQCQHVHRTFMQCSLHRHHNLLQRHSFPVLQCGGAVSSLRVPHFRRAAAGTGGSCVHTHHVGFGLLRCSH